MAAFRGYTQRVRTRILILLSVLLCQCAICAGQVHNVLTAAEKRDGWILLFDGKTMVHWNDPSKLDPAGDSWTIEDGCLKPLSNPRITEDLVSTENYKDFELQWDWRISPGGNTGVKYRIQAFPVLMEAPAAGIASKFEVRVELALRRKLFDRHLIPSGSKAAIYPVGFEFQMIDNSAHPDAKRGALYQTGSLYSILAPTKDASKAPGAFNHSRLVVRGAHFEHWLNGEKVVDITVNSDMLKQALGTRWGPDSLAVQLLSQQPNQSCPITLQNHGDPAWFRDIKIRKY